MHVLFLFILTFLKFKSNKFNIKICPFKLFPIFNIFFNISFAWIVPTIPATVPKIPSVSQLNWSSEGSASWKKHLKQGNFLFLKSKLKIWPSNLLTAPETRNFLYFKQKSFNKNFVLKLSDPSIT